MQAAGQADRAKGGRAALPAAARRLLGLPGGGARLRGGRPGCRCAWCRLEHLLWEH